MKLTHIAACLLIAAACKSKPKSTVEKFLDKAPPPTGMNVGTDNYSLYTPKGWTTDYRTGNGVKYYFLFAPIVKDDSTTSINLISEDMQNTTLDTYMASALAAFQRSPEVKMITTGDIEAHGIRGKWCNYSIAEPDVKMNGVIYVFARKGVAYVLTAGTQPKYAAKYRSTFDSVARSLTFKD